jgi:hypothetical protein
MDCLFEAIHLLAAVRRHAHAIILGNSGIGKSMFQYYYLVRILNIDKLGPLPPDSDGSTTPPRYVIRQIGDVGTEIYDIQARTVTFGPDTPLNHHCERKFTPENSLYFFESAHTKELEPYCIDIPTLMTVVPDRVRYHYLVNHQYLGVKQLSLPVWKESELLAVRNYFSTPDRYTHVLTEEEVKKRYQEFGGNLRYVFSSKVYYQQTARLELMHAIETVDLRMIFLLGCIRNIKVVINCSIPEYSG